MKGDYLAADIAQEVLMDCWQYVPDKAGDALIRLMISQRIDKAKNHIDTTPINEGDDFAALDEEVSWDSLRVELDAMLKGVRLTRKQRKLVALIIEHNIPYYKACKIARVSNREYKKLVSKIKERLDV
jgi:DNA-directed RNA polymerase specialized sigma24 family protein